MARKTGAPKREIEITPEMVRAGVDQLWEDWSLQMASEPEALVRAVYVAMVSASSGDRVLPPSNKCR